MKNPAGPGTRGAGTGGAGGAAGGGAAAAIPIATSVPGPGPASTHRPRVTHQPLAPAGPNLLAYPPRARREARAQPSPAHSDSRVRPSRRIRVSAHLGSRIWPGQRRCHPRDRIRCRRDRICPCRDRIARSRDRCRSGRPPPALLTSRDPPRPRRAAGAGAGGPAGVQGGPAGARFRRRRGLGRRVRVLDRPRCAGWPGRALGTNLPGDPFLVPSVESGHGGRKSGAWRHGGPPDRACPTGPGLPAGSGPPAGPGRPACAAWLAGPAAGRAGACRSSRRDLGRCRLGRHGRRHVPGHGGRQPRRAASAERPTAAVAPRFSAGRRSRGAGAARGARVGWPAEVA